MSLLQQFVFVWLDWDSLNSFQGTPGSFLIINNSNKTLISNLVSTASLMDSHINMLVGWLMCGV